MLDQGGTRPTTVQHFLNGSIMCKHAVLTAGPKQNAKIIKDNVNKSDKDKAAKVLLALQQPSKDTTHCN